MFFSFYLSWFPLECYRVTFAFGVHSKFVCGCFINLWNCCFSVNLGRTSLRVGTLGIVLERLPSTGLGNSKFAGEGSFLLIEVAFRQKGHAKVCLGHP